MDSLDVDLLTLPTPERTKIKIQHRKVDKMESIFIFSENIRVTN